MLSTNSIINVISDSIYFFFLNLSLPIAIKKKAKISKTIIGCITKMKTAIFRVTLSFVPRFPVDNIPLNKKKQN